MTNLQRPKRASSVALCVFATLIVSPCRALPQAPRPGAEKVVREWLQHELGSRASASSLPRYAVAWSDLNGDRRAEAIVYVSGPGWCAKRRLWDVRPGR